jgi:hypothetical protein
VGKTAANPRPVRAAQPADRDPDAQSTPAPTWPVLARIASVSRDPQAADRDARPAYRVDSPHEAAQGPVQRNQPSAASEPLPNRAELPAAPLALRLAAEIWHLVQPYQALIRFAAMLVLMVAGGMSMMVIMGGGLGPADTPPSAATPTTDQATTAVEPESAATQLDHPIDTAAAPDAKTTATPPTAVGPAAQHSHPVMAVEMAQTHRPPAYPTTPYPQAVLPEAVDTSLPQVQTTEPAVARLRGSVLEIQPR